MRAARLPNTGRRDLLKAGALGAMALAAPALIAPRKAFAEGSRIGVEGARLTYRGAPLRLTGVAMGDPIHVRYRRPLSDYAVVATDWLANCVRVSLHPGHWRADPSAAEVALARDVEAARALGLFVIICWHRIGWPGAYDPLAPADWGLPADAFLADLDETRRFWRAMAHIHGHDPGILFELWNEPSIDAYYWEATGRDWPVFKAAWEDLVAEIRRVSDAVIVCTGGFWAHDLVGVKDDPVSDARTVYAWHAYPQAHRGDHEARRATLDGLYEHHPVIVTEWGWCTDCVEDIRGTEAEFGAPLMRDTIDGLGLHYTAWSYSVGAKPNLLAAEDGTPSDYGRFVRRHLRRAATYGSWAVTS